MAGPVTFIFYQWTSLLLVLIFVGISDGLKTHQCSCYYFYSYSLSRNIADYRCKMDHNGTIVSMETVEEWKFIKTQIQNRTTDERGGNQWHIGLEKKNGEWKWSSGQNLTYNKWKPGMPDYQWKNRFAVMISAIGLFRTANDINPKGRICERKSNSQDQHQTSSKTPNPTATNNNRNTYVIIVVVLAVILVLFSIFAIVQFYKLLNKNSRQKRKDQFCETEPIEMSPIGNMGNNDATMTTVSGAEYEEIETMNKSNDAPKTMHGIPTTESEYEFAEEIPSIVDENNFVSMETEAGYTSLNKGTRISVDKNNHITMETEGGYTSLIKGTRTNGDNNNRISMEAGYTSLLKGARGNVDTNTHISMETETSGYASLIKGTLTT